MAINLLPSEERAKIKQEKQAMAPLIQMTGPAKLEKKQHPGTKGGGVLGFFKQAFQSPKKKTAEDDRALSEKKIMVENKIIFEQPRAKVKPVVEFTKSAPPAAKSSTAKTGRQPGWLARWLGGKSEKPLQMEERVSVLSNPADNGFPKYHPVKAEKIIPVVPPKPHRAEVIQLTTREWHASKPAPAADMRTGASMRSGPAFSGFPGKEKPAAPKQIVPVEKKTGPVQTPSPHGPSVWQRFMQWLKKRFARQPKPATATHATMLPPAPFQPAKNNGPVAAPRQQIMTPPLPKPAEKTEQPVPKPLPVPPAPLPTPSVTKTPAMPMATEPKQTPARTMPAFLKFGKKDHLAAPVPPPPVPPAKGKKEFLQFTQPVEPVARSGGMDWEVNLVPEEALEHEIPLSKILYIVLAAVLSMAFVFGAWFALNWTYNQKVNQVSAISNQIAEKNNTIQRYKQLETDVQVLKVRIDNIKTLLDKHISWTKLFGQLERYTIPNVYLTGMTADVNGSVTLTASGKNYESAIKQLYVLQQAGDFVKNVTISGITLTGTAASSAAAQPGNQSAVVSDPTVTFTISLSVLPTTFYQTP